MKWTDSDDLEMVRLESVPGRIGPERGLIYESKFWHALTYHPSSPPGMEPSGRFTAYRLQFWDCLAVARSFGDHDGTLINPESGRETDERFFGLLSPRTDDVPPDELGYPIYVNQILRFDMAEGEMPITVRVTPRPGQAPPVLSLVGRDVSET